MIYEQPFAESSNMAQALAKIGSTCTTADGVRLRVRAGTMRPDAITMRGSHLWTPDGVRRELEAEVALIEMKQRRR